jgi:hypothetical protein
MGCASNRIELSHEKENNPMIVKLIDNCIPWNRIYENDESAKDKREKIILTMKELDAFDLIDLRKGIEEYIKIKKSQDFYNIDCMSRLYILNRYIFNVPLKVDLNSPRFSCFAGIPLDASGINELWPLSYDAQGNLILTGKFIGYFGFEYLALQEFDYFNEKYAARRKSK